jgi:hypothetical protein
MGWTIFPEHGLCSIRTPGQDFQEGIWTIVLNSGDLSLPTTMQHLGTTNWDVYFGLDVVALQCSSGLDKSDRDEKFCQKLRALKAGCVSISRGTLVFEWICS